MHTIYQKKRELVKRADLLLSRGHDIHIFGIVFSKVKNKLYLDRKPNG